MSNSDKTILLIDDEPDLRFILKVEFELSDFKVLEANDGKEGFELIKSHKVDMIISDIRMPNWNGVRLLEEMNKELTDAPPIIFMSAYSDISALKAKEMGALEFFNKPFHLKDLVGFVIENIK